MQGDFSRVTFDPTKHYSAVLTQQGRVSLDADHNESLLITLHYLRTVMADLVGPAAIPAGTNGGFSIGLSTDAGVGLTVSPGRMYVDGILVENDSVDVTYWNQPDGHLDPDVAADTLPTADYLVYLRVWERLITARQDEGIREIALGDLGPDTSARSKVVWQVAAAPAQLASSPPFDTAETLAWLQANLVRPAAALPTLQARAITPADSTSVCDISPESHYRGPENQLYRVEVHSPGAALSPTATIRDPKGGKDTKTGRATTAPASATFTFSRENASVIFAVVGVAADTVTLADLGRDQKLALEVGDWVELLDDAYELRQADDRLPGADPVPTAPLRQVAAVDQAARVVTLTPDTLTGNADSRPIGNDPRLHPYLRRWDHRGQVAADGALAITEDVWIDLEGGVQIRFPSNANAADGSPDVARSYRRGDYWWVPARTIPGDVLWPQDEAGPSARPPNGVAYHYAPLAWVSVNGGDPQDLRPVINTLHTP